MSDDLQLSDAFMSVVEEAMNHALDSISEGGPLVPFVMIELDGQRSIERFMVGDEETWNLDESIDAAQKYVRELSGKADIAALAVDGYLDTDDGKADAILVQAFETGMSASYFFGQAYRSADDPDGFDLIGDGVLAAEDEPLW